MIAMGKRIFPCVIGLAVLMASARFPIAGQQAVSAAPRFTADNQLLRPDNYREWIWLSSGLGMSYGPAAQSAREPVFDNVFVTPAAYRSFLETGRWPDKTMFVLELRSAVSGASINKAGRSQGEIAGMEVEVKDESRFPGKWGFFDFRAGVTQAKMIPKSEACYACHGTNGAVDNTFVQFYPTLIEVAKQKGTLKPAQESPAQ
jgi:Cytochrome P460